jgi:hypothetical protein
MMLSKSRLKELEEQWKCERLKRAASARTSITKIPADMIDMARLYRGPKRPERLRTADLVQELARLALEWGDRRFAECARALFELDIVDKQGRLLPKKRGPHVYLKDKPLDDVEVSARVRTLKEENPGMSIREACAVITAELGWGNTRTTRFVSACQDVRNALQRATQDRG